MESLALLYAPTDQPRARQLARALGHRGLSCWLVDDHGAGLGRARAERVAEGVRGADAAVVLLTEVAIASGWAALEPAGLVSEALAGRPVTVVREPGVEVPEGMRVDRVVGWTEGREADHVAAEVLGLEPEPLGHAAEQSQREIDDLSSTGSDAPGQPMLGRTVGWMADTASLAPVPGRAFMPVELAFRELSNPDAIPEQTLTRCAEASALAESREDLPNAARAALYQGILEGRRGGVQAAQAALLRGLRLAHRAEDAPLAAHARRLLGDAALQAAHYEDARSWYAEAIARFEALGLHQDALRARLLLVPVQIEFGRLAEAAPHLTALRAALANPALPPDLARDAAAVLELGDRAAAQRAGAAEAPVG